MKPGGYVGNAPKRKEKGKVRFEASSICTMYQLRIYWYLEGG